ncbi:MAG TPA: nuclear transport factor 2 family protein [Steroidobacteraceae bacterium]
MKQLSITPRAMLATAMLATMAGCCGGQSPGAASAAAEVAAASLSWKQTFNAGDPAAVTALYAEDAILSAPGIPVVKGRAAIGGYFVRTAAEFAAAGLTVADAPLGDAVASGDLGYQWKTYSISDHAGAVVGSGQLLTVFRRTAGRWLIIADTWNPDGTTPAGAAH